MSAQEQSLKAKMAQLKAKKEAEAKAAAAAAAGGGTAAGGPNGVPAAFKAMMLPLGAGSAPPRPIGHPALAAPVAAARKPGAATGATAQSSGPKPIPRPSSGPKPLPVPPRPGAGVASAGAAGSVARAAGAVGAAAASPSVKHAGSSLGLSVTPTPAPPAAAVPKRRILRKPDADSIDSSAAAATAAGAAAVAAKAVPSIAAASAGGAPLNFISKPSTAPVVGLKRKKQSGPAQGPVELVLTNDSGESKRPRVSLANTDHLAITHSREQTVLRTSIPAPAAPLLGIGGGGGTANGAPAGTSSGIASGGGHNHNSSGVSPGFIRRATPQERCTLFIDGLAPGVTARDLEPAFAPYGRVEEWNIPPGQPYGTLRFRTRDAASMVVDQLDNSVAAGSLLHLEWYLPRERGTLAPTMPALTRPDDLQRYHAFAAESIPDSFEQMMAAWKPHIVQQLKEKEEKENGAQQSNAEEQQRQRALVKPFVPLTDRGIMTREGTPRKTAEDSAATRELPQMPTDMPPRELVPYDVEYK